MDEIAGKVTIFSYCHSKFAWPDLITGEVSFVEAEEFGLRHVPEPFTLRLRKFFSTQEAMCAATAFRSILPRMTSPTTISMRNLNLHIRS